MWSSITRFSGGGGLRFFSGEVLEYSERMRVGEPFHDTVS